MPSWEELENRFQALEIPLQFTRLDAQWGAAGENWRLAGSYDRDTVRRFEATAALAGQKLVAVLPKDHEFAEQIHGASDAVLAWYRALRHLGQAMRVKEPLSQVTAAGEFAGHIHSGTIDKPAAASATLCLELSASSPEPAMPSLAPSSPLNISVSGPQSRININSTDLSSNVISANHATIFKDLRSAIVQQVPEPQRASLLSRVDAMEKSAGTPSFLDRYKDFMGVLSDHVTVLSPFLPALADLLARGH